MNDVDVLAVVGTCGPERSRHALRLAAVADRTLVPAWRLRLAPDPVDEALALAPWADRPAGAVVEFPADTRVLELIGAMTAPGSRTRLSGLVCVADAMHLLDDLRRDGYAARPRTTAPGEDAGAATEYMAHALLTVTQLEYASMIVLVNWENLATPNLAALMALVSHLSPHARLRLDHGPLAVPDRDEAYTATQERAGWVAVLNGEHAPHMTDPRVGKLHYEQVRPFHPGRLERFLDDRVDTGEFGTVLRSAGFCRLASRPGVVAAWSHVGHMLSLEPLAADGALAEDEEVLAVGQDLAFFGLDLRADALRTALDEACLADAELAAGPAAWRTYPDPFPAWAHAGPEGN
ncbi:hypothetical protein E7744_01530 [Citricoccus sp. SGAir0253]|uniref:GTP-binding protein n=1 Tax=Citricoccus sp. SGAir0253 TaxID=2567881 RepID=UPI0010CD0B89|nr:GTP-binding protein [Citricoccus sp. SGAir0253]QCU77048.1 hypothetical protein E7744_01530 [Citricoccus sp. SGAir0253]